MWTRTLLIIDADDNICTSATNAVTLTKNGSATWGTLTSATGLTKNAVGGVVTFTDLIVTVTPGIGAIDANASGLIGAISNDIAISLLPSGGGGGGLGRLRIRIR